MFNNLRAMATFATINEKFTFLKKKSIDYNDYQPLIGYDAVETIEANEIDGEFEVDSYASGREVTLTWSDISAYVKSTNSKEERHCLLHEVSGLAKSGSILAVMGSSGSGKTTLMNILGGRSSSDVKTKGSVSFRGHPIKEISKDLCGYVEQDDIFFESLTPKEHLTFMVNIKLQQRMSKAARKEKVDNLLSLLGLKCCSNAPIGGTGSLKGLSGGEKKRLSLATEIITDPELLFCDEVTTGLDSYSAEHVISILQGIAHSGKTVICTIHGPSSEVYSMFSHLLLLADGRVAYHGTTSGALDFFSKLGHECPACYNPSDFFIHKLSVTSGSGKTLGENVRQICNNFTISHQARNIRSAVEYHHHVDLWSSDSGTYTDSFPDPNRKKCSKLNQFAFIYWRSMLETTRNPQRDRLRIIQKVMLAIMISVTFVMIDVNQKGVQDMAGIIFIIVSENTFPNMYSVVNTFPGELPIFKREYRSGAFSIVPYYLGKVISLFPALVLEVFVFTSIIYSIAGLRSGIVAYMNTLIIAFLVANVSSACGFFFSSLFESVDIALTLLIPFDVLLMASGGLFINPRSLPPYISWAQYISWFKFGNEALFITQWGKVSNITCEFTKAPCLTTGAEVIDEYGFDSNNFYFDILGIILLYVAFHTLGCLGLWRRARRL